MLSRWRFTRCACAGEAAESARASRLLIGTRKSTVKAMTTAEITLAAMVAVLSAVIERDAHAKGRDSRFKDRYCAINQCGPEMV
jgi:hypothetical protein